MGRSAAWGYARIITGTLVGGALGFYVMHRLEISYKVRLTLLCYLRFINSYSFAFLTINLAVVRLFGRFLLYTQEKWDERLKKYEEELNKKKEDSSKELQESL
ncbi:hypothetical protein RJ640_011329 [Escallonia rubra]|uniref:Uncharacterized protein n=1 Tax=Escallonia rubra TaxID=112253 RepID=A0AA88UGM5_9ASTE|nr:hypothetical protein RJ640_011329 [Escallonia rubra]